MTKKAARLRSKAPTNNTTASAMMANGVLLVDAGGTTSGTPPKTRVVRGSTSCPAGPATRVVAGVSAAEVDGLKISVGASVPPGSAWAVSVAASSIVSVGGASVGASVAVELGERVAVPVGVGEKVAVLVGAGRVAVAVAAVPIPLLLRINEGGAAGGWRSLMAKTWRAVP